MTLQNSEHRFLGMEMIFLIDAYNLMHAVGYLSPATPFNRMESSRRRLLDWLGDNARTRTTDRFHVVFDAKTAPKPSADSVYRGVTVSFAFQESADDYLERMLRDAKPGTVTLVTNDTIIQAAATKYRSPFLSCTGFVDWLITPVVPQKVTPVDPEKPEPTGAEVELLRIFSQRKK